MELAVAKDRAIEEKIEAFASQAHLMQDSRETYRRAARFFVEFCRGRSFPDATAAARAWAEELVRQKAKPNTIQLYVTVARVFVRFLGYDVGEVKLPRKPQGFLRDALTPEEFAKLAGGFAGPELEAVRNRAIVSLLAVTGIRVVEAYRADVEDLRDVGEHVLYVKRKGHTEKDSFVVVPPALLAVLKEWLKAREPLAKSPALFISLSDRTRGRRLARPSIRWIVRRAMKEAGLTGSGKRLSPHSLRHTAGTTGLLEGADVRAVQRMLDHKDINTTLNYDHSLSRLKDAPERLVADRLLGERMRMERK